MSKYFFFLFFFIKRFAQDSSLDVISNSKKNSHISFNTGNVEFIKTENRGELFIRLC